MRTISPTLARRLAITRQRLAGPRPAPDAAGILELFRDLGCVQLDPINVVARSHLLVLWSRLGAYDPADGLDSLLWGERRLFEYWAHAASVVLTEDYPIHLAMMRAYARGDTGWEQRVRSWLEMNEALHRQVLTRLREEGPLLARQFRDHAAEGWESTGWTNGRNVSRMLDILWRKGEIMVAGRSGLQKQWDLAERCLPDWTPREPWPGREVVRQAAQRSLRALGVAHPRHIVQHFTRGRYPDLAGVLADLEAEGRVEPVRIKEGDRTWPGRWYVHADDLPLLERLAGGEWAPRTTLLSPFDNLICDRLRTESLFRFSYRSEIYTPKDKRQYGYYVMPILHGDQLVGRLDPALDRKQRRLTIHAVHVEPEAPPAGQIAPAVAQAVEELAAFLGATEVVYGSQLPAGWQPLQ